MHMPRERLHVLDGRHRQDAVSEIEDVSGAPGGAREDVIRRGDRAVDRSEEERRIEVALDRPIGSDFLPCLIERRAPVDADHLSVASEPGAVAPGSASRVEDALVRSEPGAQEVGHQRAGVAVPPMVVLGRRYAREGELTREQKTLLCYSEYVNGAWQTTKTSNQDKPATVWMGPTDGLRVLEKSLS